MAEVAPGIGLAPLVHWKAMGALPVTVTLKVAACPAMTEVLAGCAVMAGA